LFVFAGTAFLVLVLYLIGSKRNLFSSTITLKANFTDAQGLMKGNAVRFSGINIGVVKAVNILDDTTIQVIMEVSDEFIANIRTSAVASIGTDGLMGNRLVNIYNEGSGNDQVTEGFLLTTRNALNTNKMLETLSMTNDNVKQITDDLKLITQKLNSNNSLWNLLSDTVLAENVKNAIVSIKVTGDRSAFVIGDLQKLITDTKKGKGSLGALLVDTSLSGNLHQSVVKINVISNQLAEVSGDLSMITGQVKEGKGTLGTLIMDTTFVHDMNKTINNLKEGTQGFTDNMEAFKHSIFLRRYFKKKAKKEK
jgi:phospholipid/cholesterol/gamma-HCH transport system substrate-binding protein